LQRGLAGFSTEFAEDAERGKVKNRDVPVSKRMVRLIVGEVKRRGGQLGANHVNAVLELARSARSGRTVHLPGGVEVRREHSTLVFRAPPDKSKAKSKTAAPEFEHQIHLTGNSQDVRVPQLGCVFRLRVIDWPPKRGETNILGVVLDRDRLRSPMILRNWQPGDRLQPTGRRNAHKLKRLLNEKRVSKWEREGWPVLTSGDVLAWARGFPAAAEFAADERTRAGMVIQEEALTVATREEPR